MFSSQIKEILYILSKHHKGHNYMYQLTVNPSLSLLHIYVYYKYLRY